MFSPSTYRTRQQRLIERMGHRSGLVLLLGNEPSPITYSDNTYPFRQDSTFLYYFGLDLPHLSAIIDLDEGRSTLYGRPPTLEEIVWTGGQPSMEELGTRCGLSSTGTPAELSEAVQSALEHERSIHFLPPYRSRHRLRLESLVGIQADALGDYASEPLIRTVVQQRSTKSQKEVAQLDEALTLTARLHTHAMRRATPGITERQIVGDITGIATSEGCSLSFRPTCTIHGEILHNHSYDNTLQAGDLLLLDAGATSPLGYVGDVTRVTPVGGSFTDRQRALYEAVLEAQTEAVGAIEPGIAFKEIHLLACQQLTKALIDLGLMKGDPAEAVKAGAHALFFPHGLGHLMGLDPHDMENLGEDLVGYADDQSRSEQFGLDALRLARPLQEGFVVTVEPGCYFIPPLIDHWRQEQRHERFINYDVVEDYKGVGGIRIEDDFVVTEEGGRTLGPDIPKTPDDVEAMAGEAPST